MNDVNAGHGRTTRRAIDASTGEWIFHLDSDGQVDVAEFALLWERRHDHDLVLGMRIHRHDPLHRLILTRFTRTVVSALARDGCATPTYRSSSSAAACTSTSAAIPATAFAPSIMIVIGAHRSRARGSPRSRRPTWRARTGGRRCA